MRLCYSVQSRGLCIFAAVVWLKPSHMAEAPAAPAPVEASPAPLTSIADLDVRMAEIKANPPTDAADTAPVQGAPAPAAATDAPPTPVQPAEPVQGNAPEDGEEPGADSAKPGGRFARLRDQLAAAETRARQYEQHFQTSTAQQQQALREFVDLVLPDAQLDALRLQAEGGDWEAKQRVDTARQWRRMAAPIADLAHRAVKQQFDAALADMRTLDGMDGDAHQKLLGATTPADQLRLMWQTARKSSDDAHKERIAALEAEVEALKTNKAANGSQPASGGGRASAGSAALAGWLGPDGLPTEEAIQKARSGAFRNLGTP